MAENYLITCSVICHTCDQGISIGTVNTRRGNAAQAELSQSDLING